jgi:hypothetical protein
MGFASLANAGVVLPGDLNPGDHYRIIFISSTMGDALSSNISDYDAFVTAAANASGSGLASLGATWVAIGSTPTVDALSHVGSFTSPLYNTAGLLVASSSTALWSGTLSNAVGYDESGNALNGSSDTGTSSDGTGSSGLQLGNSGGLVLDGQANSTTSSWVAGGVLPESYAGRHFYGISSDLIFGEVAAPEPGTLGLMLMGAVILTGARRRRRSV